MPTKFCHVTRSWARLAALAAAAALTPLAQAQTDDAAPFYVGGSLGASHVSNLYHEANSSNSDTVISVGVLGGLDERWGRQHFKLDGSLQDNRYSTNRKLNNQSYTLAAGVDWQTIGDLSGTLSAKSDRALGDFNIGNGVTQIFKKNTERNDALQAIARLGVTSRYGLEGGWSYRRRDFSVVEYDRFDYSQSTGSLGVYATPGGNVRLGLSGRHTSGKNPRYPIGVALNQQTSQFEIVNAVNNFTRNDLDFTTRWSTGGSSVLSTRISRTSAKNELAGLSDFSGTTGAVEWNWRATSKLQFDLQYSRDTGQESVIRATDVNRIYTTWQVSSTYALTGKVALNAGASDKRTRRNNVGDATNGSFANDKTLNVGLRWAFSRSLSLGCEYDHASRDSNVAQYIYTASSYGCTGQAILY